MAEADRIRNIHVCIISCFPPSEGPLSEYTLYLANGLSSSPAISRITVIGDMITKPETNTDRKVTIKRSWKLDSIMTPFKIVEAVLKLKAKPDIVYFNLVFRQFSASRLKNFLGLLSPLVVKLLGFPVIITLHSIGEAFDLTKAGYKDSFINNLGIRMATRALLFVDTVTLTHNHLVKVLKQEYKAKNVRFVPHGVFDAVLPSCNLRGNSFLVFGKFGPYKNLRLILDAFKEISSFNQEAKLIVAGGSHPLHPGFLELIREDFRSVPNVSFTGYVLEEDIAEIFMRASIVLLPYTSSVWSSGVFILCSIYGRPVIASDLPDFMELREQGAGIISFESGNKRDLVKEMNTLLANKPMQQRLGELNLEWAKNNDFEKTIENILFLFQETISRKKKFPLRFW